MGRRRNMVGERSRVIGRKKKRIRIRRWKGRVASGAEKLRKRN